VKQLALTAIALLLGALATFFAAQSMGLLGPSAASSEVMLVVAAAPIAAGQVIESGQVKTMAWPRGKAPEQSFLKASAVVGRVAKHPIYPGELLLEPKLAAVDARGGLASTIESGKRAISVGVNEVVGVTGFALPGSYVDVLVSAKDAANAPFATTVLTRINRKARIIICGAISQYNNKQAIKGPANYLNLLVNSARMEGMVVMTYAPRVAEAAAEMGGWLASGQPQLLQLLPRRGECGGGGLLSASPAGHSTAE
jgi:Flp pilus assembly protein CpaB